VTHVAPRAPRALVNGRYLTRAPTGVDRFAIELTAALARRPGAAPLPLAVPGGVALADPAAAQQHDVRRVGRRRGHAWEQLELPAAAAGLPLLNLCNTAPLWLQRQLVVIHDLGTVANAANYSVAFRGWYRLMHGTLMRRAHVVATVSRFSADALQRHHGRRARGIEVLPEGGEHILRVPADRAIVERMGLQGRRYVLAVGSRSPNKNFAAVVQAVQSLGEPDVLVVAVGGGNARVFAGSEVEGDGVRHTGYVSDAELRALYEHATCFAFPSFYEGFGLPPLEAMCCGCPVIVSDRAALPETCGDAALYCRAEDPATLAAALRRVLDSPALRQELREAGHRRAALYGWDGAASLFEEVLDARLS